MPKIDPTRIPSQIVTLAASLVLLGAAMALDLKGAAGIAAGLLATCGVLLAAKSAAEPEKSDGPMMMLFGAVVLVVPFLIAPIATVPASAFVAHLVSGGAIFARARLETVQARR